MKKKSAEHETDVALTEQTAHTAVKKKFKSADLVFLGGIVAIIAGMFWMIGGSGTDEKQSTPVEENATVLQPTVATTEKKVSTTTPAPAMQISDIPNPTLDGDSIEKVAVDTKPPFVYSNKADFSTDTLVPPPEEYEQNLTRLAKKQAAVEKKSTSSEKKQVPKPQTEVKRVASPTVTTPASDTQRERPKEKASNVVLHQSVKPLPSATQSSATYVCSILDGYKEMLGKEIMYYLHDNTTHKYLPAFSQPNWDESGVWVKKRFIASKVDTKERMVEVSPNKWIPALEFMSCTVVQEEGR